MEPGELRTALRIVWLALSSIVLATLLTPWILTPAQIAAAVPKCEWKARYGTECLLCGMTTAFIAISRGRLGEAERSNRGAIPLYTGFVLNEAAVLVFSLKGRWNQPAPFPGSCSAS